MDHRIIGRDRLMGFLPPGFGKLTLVDNMIRHISPDGSQQAVVILAAKEIFQGNPDLAMEPVHPIQPLNDPLLRRAQTMRLFLIIRTASQPGERSIENLMPSAYNSSTLAKKTGPQPSWPRTHIPQGCYR
jgi:hypothetical protein